MIACAHNETKKHGKDRHGNQRYRCLLCGKTSPDQALKLLGDMKIFTWHDNKLSEARHFRKS